MNYQTEKIGSCAKYVISRKFSTNCLLPQPFNYSKYSVFKVKKVISFFFHDFQSKFINKNDKH